MANLIVEHPRAASGETLDGTLIVGRGDDADIVLEHPTVSRHHAIIDRVAGQYFVTDLNSRNGTRVNGRTVRQRLAIATGDKIRFGHMRVTFVVSTDDAGAVTHALEQAPSATAEPGILFDCACGIRLWAKRETARGIVECGKCKRQVVVPEVTMQNANSETVSGVAVAAPPETLSAPVQTGTCSICQWQTSREDQITSCPACGLTFHIECWNENGGCSAYGCSQVNVRPPRPLRPSGPDERAFEQEPDEIAAPPATSVDAMDARIPIGLAMLAASIIAGVLGLLAFGGLSVLTLFAAGRFAATRRQNEGMLTLAMFVSLVGVLAGAVVSSVWWLGVKL